MSINSTQHYFVITNTFFIVFQGNLSKNRIDKRQRTRLDTIESLDWVKYYGRASDGSVNSTTTFLEFDGYDPEKNKVCHRKYMQSTLYDEE